MSEPPTALVRLIARIADVPAVEVTPHARFEELGNWSSLNALRLLNGLEDRYGISLDLRTYLRVQTVAELVDVLGAAGAALNTTGTAGPTPAGR